MSEAGIYFSRLGEAIARLDMSEADRCVEVIRAAWERGAQIITFGNGGSAMTSLNFMTDWTKMILMATGKPFFGRSLVDNIGILTAYSNDVSYQDVFKEQLKGVARPGDVAVAISGSGNSENVIRAVDYANHNGMFTLGLSGFDGGRLRGKCRNNFWVDSRDMQLIEDIHASFGHIVMRSLCKTL